MYNRSFSLIQDSFDQVRPNVDRVATHFFTGLFGLSPELRSLFPPAPAQQQALFLEMLTYVAENLQRIDLLLLRMQTLGTEVAAYDLQPTHYDALLAALLEALTSNQEHPLTAETRVAWCEIYTLLVNAVQRVAEHGNGSG
jgi:hemoglobin-like flavoprotein